MNREEVAFRKFVEKYDIEVPEEKVENEYNFIRIDMKHRMQYEQMTGGEMHIFPDQELSEREEELRELAYFEAKSELVLKELMKDPQFDVSGEELAEEAERLFTEEGTSIEMIKQFFGEDFSGLTRDVKERKIKRWICENYPHD